MQKVRFGGMEQLDAIDSNASTNTASTLSTLGFTITRASTAAGQREQDSDEILLYIEGNSVRYGAGTPTTSKGLVLQVGEYLLLESMREIETVKFISAVAGLHATINAQIGYSR